MRLADFWSFSATLIIILIFENHKEVELWNLFITQKTVIYFWFGKDFRHLHDRFTGIQGVKNISNLIVADRQILTKAIEMRKSVFSNFRRRYKFSED